MCLYNLLNYIGSCGGEINLELESNTTTIESPNYPLDYIEDINCKWYITTPPGTYARITFSHFSTESVYDTVKLYMTLTLYVIVSKVWVLKTFL